MDRFFQDYKKVGGDKKWFDEYLKLVEEQSKNPFSFEPYHTCIRKPYDYYRFGIEFFCPLVDKASSRVEGKQYIQEVVAHLKKGHNVILFANHQIEADPLVISLLLDEEFPHFAEEMIIVAGERVITDPLAIPFSMGRNLLCIYSKRYIDHPPEKKGKSSTITKKRWS